MNTTSLLDLHQRARYYSHHSNVGNIRLIRDRIVLRRKRNRICYVFSWSSLPAHLPSQANI